MRRTAHRPGFTLVELLVVIGIVALLAAISLPVYNAAVQQAHRSVCASNMHGLGIALLSYAYDNQGLLPGRVITGPRWPSLLLPYVDNEVQIYIDPGDPVARKFSPTDLISDSVNNSSFIFNGFNDLGALNNPNYKVSIFDIPATSSLVLLGQQHAGGDNFYLDVNNGDQNTVLNKQAYFGGANYIFADGSLRFIKAANYNDTMWLVNTNYVIP